MADTSGRVWRPEAGAAIAEDAAETIARQASSFLGASVHAEIDGARVGVTRIMATADGGHVYAGAVVTGPLRAYLATVAGPAAHVAHKYIVSYADVAGARTALDAALARQERQGYALIGTVDGEA